MKTFMKLKSLIFKTNLHKEVTNKLSKITLKEEFKYTINKNKSKSLFQFNTDRFSDKTLKKKNFKSLKLKRSLYNIWTTKKKTYLCLVKRHFQLHIQTQSKTKILSNVFGILFI